MKASRSFSGARLVPAVEFPEGHEFVTSATGRHGVLLETHADGVYVLFLKREGANLVPDVEKRIHPRVMLCPIP